MIRYLPHLISFFVGFVSLSVEIIWMRVAGFAGNSTPKAFAYVLASYLVGIAFGANVGKDFCAKERDLWRLLAGLLILSIAGNLFSVAGFAVAADHFASSAWGMLAVLICASAAIMAAVFPIVHHLSGDGNAARLGRSVSGVYCANIFGATLGPFVTCFGLLACLGTQRSLILLQMILALGAVLCLVPARLTQRKKYGNGALLLAVACFLAIALIPEDGIFKRIAIKREGQQEPTRVLETNRGVVTVYSSAEGGDYIFGGNVYDGRSNVDPVINSNHIDRVTILDALVEKPKRVLVIGLSVGSWLTLAVDFPGIETIDAVEINDGYVKLIQDYPPQRAALADPRVHLYIADGVKWLRDHPDNVYDLIIMNTTYYWRNYSSNLLSAEMMHALFNHMTPKAVLTFNTTGSIDAFATAASVFPYTVMRLNFVLASRSDFITYYSKDEATERLLALHHNDGTPLYYDGPNGAARKAAEAPFMTLDEAKALINRPPEIITLDNMLTEYKYGK